MAQVTLCDHCGQQIDESTNEFARVQFQVAQGGGGQLDYHNTAEKSCFYTAYEAVKGVSAFPDKYPDVAVPPAAPAAEEPKAEIPSPFVPADNPPAAS